MAAQTRDTLHIRSAELCRTPPESHSDDQFVAQLGSLGLGSASFVVGRRAEQAPEWIVLDYATDGHERTWRRGRSDADGMIAYVFVEDDSSNGYVSARSGPCA